ncbi:helix-turn-helix domain-containing protein [Aerococcus urinaeequi]|uniref:Helix-turn-helix domain-containing protein n=1 Tax=Aerococcus urinaeequi TaxID=51665 RepID=A0AA47GA89_9LACT|nr:helix-turn-helix domain-containing protein [Aerococcus urinaeequi]WAT24876.1 helix-turn-helix domain-containing protein [Aerococcus urinaeequi]
MEIDKQAVGNRIRQIRQELKLSMEKFGKLIGDLPRSTVNNWERGINLPKTETLHQIAEVGHVTNEYLLYGDQENQYILEMLQKKAGKLDPKIESLIVDEMKQAGLISEKEMDRMIEFFITNLIPPTEQDQFTFQCIDEKKRLYLGSTNFGKEAQLYLHHDNQNHILHMMPFIFSNFSVDRLLVYLANQESYSYFGKHLPKKLVENAILLYSINQSTGDVRIAPLVYSKETASYQYTEANQYLLEQQYLYLPFAMEIEKERLLNATYPPSK